MELLHSLIVEDHCGTNQGTNSGTIFLKFLKGAIEQIIAPD
jgi:hypothetical protein